MRGDFQPVLEGVRALEVTADQGLRAGRDSSLSLRPPACRLLDYLRPRPGELLLPLASLVVPSLECRAGPGIAGLDSGPSAL